MNESISMPSSTGQDPVPDAVDLARRLAESVQQLVRQLDDQEERRAQLEQRLAHATDQAASAESRRQSMADALGGSITEEDLRTLEQVLERLSQDPNHIMVLAAVAQQAGTLLQVVEAYGKLRSLAQ